MFVPCRNTPVHTGLTSMKTSPIWKHRKRQLQLNRTASEEGETVWVEESCRSWTTWSVKQTRRNYASCSRRDASWAHGMRSVLWPSLGYGWDGVASVARVARAARAAAVKVGVGGGQKTVERKTINRIPEECKSKSVWILDTLLGPTIDRATNRCCVSAQTTSRGQQ